MVRLLRFIFYFLLFCWVTSLGGKNHPSKFPNGEKILELVPQIVIDPNCVDKLGAPICVEQYAFSPSTVFDQISLEEYITFVIYSLEYKSLILEQLSEQKEREILKEYQQALTSSSPVDPNTLPPYGVILHTCVIRDLNGIGFEHLGAKGQEIIKAVVNVASDNYPELMHKCHMLNTPWLFNTVWWVIKGWLAPRYNYSHHSSTALPFTLLTLPFLSNVLEQSPK
jgi:hypothetical protein